MTLPDIFFAAICMVMIVSALMAVSLKNVFYNALSLILCLFCVACVFIYLNSEFLAILEIIIYIGAILFFGIFKILKKSGWPLASIYGDYSMAAIGRSLLTTNVLPFEAVSLVLLVAIIGALVISNTKSGLK